MCILMCVPEGKVNKISEDIIDNCFEMNSDGIGYAFYNTNGKLNLKTFMDLDDFKGSWEEDLDNMQKRPVLLHFRATSKGETSPDNCHPFKIDGDCVFGHNGTIIKVRNDPQGKKSDTRMFNQDVLTTLPKGWTSSGGIREMIEEYIGASKIAVLDRFDQFTIYNEEKGHWADGIWWSNDHYTGKWSRNNYGVAVKKYKKATKTYSQNRRIFDNRSSDIQWDKCDLCQRSFHPDVLVPFDFGYGDSCDWSVCEHCRDEALGED